MHRPFRQENGKVTQHCLMLILEKVTEITIYDTNEQPISSKMKGIIYSFHTGQWGGIITRIAIFSVCVRRRYFTTYRILPLDKAHKSEKAS